MIREQKLKLTIRFLSLLFYLSPLQLFALEKDSLPDLVFQSEQLEVDLLNRYYTFNAKEQILYKFSADKILNTFPSIDGITMEEFGLNSMHKLFMFSQTNQLLYILDNEFGLLQTFSFEDLDLFNITSVDYNSNDNLWVLDGNSRKVMEFNLLNKQMQNSFTVREIPNLLDEFKLKITDSNIFVYNDAIIYTYSTIGEFLYTNHVNHPFIISDEGAIYYFKDGLLYLQQRLMPRDKELLSDETNLNERLCAIKNGNYYKKMGKTFQILPIK